MTKEEFIEALDRWRDEPGNMWCNRDALIEKAATLHCEALNKLGICVHGNSMPDPECGCGV